ncbi:MAG: cell wall-binding repeat-containing protein [Candidatus Micrarchaeia archaeon]
MNPRFACLFTLFFLLAGAAFSTTLLLNSQEYEDIIASAVYAAHNNYSFVFALTPNQSVFISKYYTADKNEPIIYLEGNSTILPNMAALVADASPKNLTSILSQSPRDWVAQELGKDEAIVVGSTYGQDALSVSSYAALVGAPIYFISNPSQSQDEIEKIVSRGYKKVIFYGSIAEQMPLEILELVPNREIIDTGSRYSNNMQITKRFLQISPTTQAMFVSGYSFEKSMVDSRYPLLLVGRSDIPSGLSSFLSQNNISSGIVYSGDSDIVEGINKLKVENPQIAFFVKFGEGYRGSSQPLPLMIIPLPSPNLGIQIANLTYNVPAKSFELMIANKGDFAAVSAGASVEGAGTAQSSQVLLDEHKQTTLVIPLDASSAISGGKIPSVTISLRYGEDVALMDNIDTVVFSNVQTSFYNDTSSVRLIGLDYSDDEKAFVLTFDGNGWAEGTLGFNINDRPVILRVPLSQINGVTKVRIKHLLSADEQKFVNGLGANYFLRSGMEQDILLKEDRGQSAIYLSVPKSSGMFGSLKIEPIYVFIIVVLIVLALLAAKFFIKNDDSFV